MGWCPTLTDRLGPLYRRIVEALAEDIASGRLHRGQQLPTHRALAANLGIDLTTVTRAYGEARRQGLIQARAGQGSFVADHRTPVANPPRTDVAFDLSMIIPPAPPEADLEGRIARGMAALHKDVGYAPLLAYRDFRGRAAERRIAAAWLGRRIPTATGDRLIIFPGAQNALLSVLIACAHPGDIVLVERHTYPGILAAAEVRQVRLVGVETDGEGILPDAFEAACRRHSPKLLYLNPTIQNPTTATLSAQRRKEVAEIVRRYGLFLIEDDAYGQLAPEIVPLAAHCPERTFHVATLSKCIAPGLRVAFLLAPDASSAGRIYEAQRATVYMPTQITVGLVARWLSDGSADTIIAAIRNEAAARQNLAAAILGDQRYAAHPNGHHLWLSLSNAGTTGDFTAYLKRRGVAVECANAFRVGGKPVPAIRLSLGASPDRPKLVQALEILAAALNASRAGHWI